MVDERDPQDARTVRSRVGVFLFLVAVIGLAAAPTLSGIAHRLHEAWQPQGDDAEIAWLTRDVFTAKSPLLGMPSTVGGKTGSHTHHWGPLLFWVLSVPQKVAGGHPAGLQIALLIVALAAVTAVAAFTYRRAGRLGTLLILVLLGAVGWSLGRQVLSSIWNPNAALLPLVCLFVLAWSVSDGDRVAMPFLVFAGSFVAQCNLLYTPLVAALVLWAVIGFGLTYRDERRAQSAPNGPQLRRTLLVSGIVLLLCWSAPIVYEITHRPGNVEQVLENGTGESGQHVGIVRTFYALARTIGAPPFWSHPMSSLRDIFVMTSFPPIATTATGIGIALVLLGGFAWAWRQDRWLRSLLGTAIAGLGGTAVVVVRLPVTFGIAPYRLWTLWIAGMFAWFAFLVVAARVIVGQLPQLRDPRSRRNVTRAAAIGLSLALVLVATLGATGMTPKFLREEDSSTVVSRLVDGARRNLPGPGPYLAVQNAFAIGSGVLWGLERHGYDIRISKSTDGLDAPYLAASHGPGRTRLRRLYLVTNLTPYAPIPHGRKVSSATVPSTAAQRRAYQTARAEACRVFALSAPPITAQGRRFLRRAPREPDARALALYARDGNPCRLVEYSLLQRLVDRQAIKLNREQTAELFKLAFSKQSNQTQKFAIYLGPP